MSVTSPDTVSFIMGYEADELTHEEVVEGFQKLIDSGIVWNLQGSYGRKARELIASGECTQPNSSARPLNGKVGPFEGVTRDIVRIVGNERYRLVLYSAYNAQGLIGSECNGIAVLSEDRLNVVCDELGKDSFRSTPTPAQIALFERLETCDEETFRATVNSASRSRYSI